MASPDPRRLIPRTDAVLADPRLVDATDRLGRVRVKAAVTHVLDGLRAGDPAANRWSAESVADEVLRGLPAGTSLRRVINATGVVLHTNLGRAALSSSVAGAVLDAAGYVDLEFDLGTGSRARRGRGALEALRRSVDAAADVLVVNNGAAALLLATTTLAAGKEVIVSRGELVEVGDGFRLPELIESTGATLREVGATNRVTAADYEMAVSPNTGCILKVHPSNFTIEGFTNSVEISELTNYGVPVVADLGSGLLAPDPLLPDEPDVRSALAAGAAVVTCSGDKLLGGPQAGLVFGDAQIVERMRRHPLARAVRVDKLTLAALEATLEGQPTPTVRALHADPVQLRRRCVDVAAAVAHAADAAVVESPGVVGGGGAPGVILAGWAVALPARLAAPLRTGHPSVVGRIERDRCLLDLRCVEEADDGVLAAAVIAASAPADGR